MAINHLWVSHHPPTLDPSKILSNDFQGDLKGAAGNEEEIGYNLKFERFLKSI